MLSKDYPNFSYIHRINSKTQIRLKPKSSKHCTILKPHHFSTKIRTTFTFIEVFPEDKPDTRATPIQNSTNHIATLPTGLIGFIEIPITNGKPKYHHVYDINTLIHNVTHT